MTANDLKNQAKEAVAATKTMADTGMEKVQAAAHDTAKIASKSTKVFEDTSSILTAAASDWQATIFDMTKSNLDANFSFAQKLFSASTPMEAFEMQKSFAEDRAAVLRKQTTELGAMATKVAEEAAKPARDGMILSFDEAKKAFTA